jgi:deazaflavin-dependent oxidoreductase (nitroreductase family)
MLGRVSVALSHFANARGLYVGPRSAKVHVAVYRWSRGRLGDHLPGLTAARVLLLDHIGAKSGIRRTSPVMYHENNGTFAVVASKAGQPTHPAWFHNLRAHPDTSIQVGQSVHDVRARTASDEERERLWPEMLAFYPGYDFYEQLAAPRKIPVVILEPRG